MLSGRTVDTKNGLPTLRFASTWGSVPGGSYPEFHYVFGSFSDSPRTFELAGQEYILCPLNNLSIRLGLLHRLFDEGGIVDVHGDVHAIIRTNPGGPEVVRL
jgi:hypothetical protein